MTARQQLKEEVEKFEAPVPTLMGGNYVPAATADMAARVATLEIAVLALYRALLWAGGQTDYLTDKVNRNLGRR